LHSALVLGLLAAWPLIRQLPWQSTVPPTVLLPLILPGIITGLPAHVAVFAGAQLSLFTVFWATAPRSFLSPPRNSSGGCKKWTARRTKLRDLGATPWQTFWRITLPNLKLSLIASGLLIFTLSMDENRASLSS